MMVMMIMLMAVIIVMNKRNYKGNRFIYLTIFLLTYADLAPVGVRVNTVS